MGRLGLLLVAVIALLVACTPSTVSGSEPVFYGGSKSAVFAAVLQAISTSPGLDDSNGWIVMQSDSEGGFIRAETSVMLRAFLGIPTGEYERHTLSVVLSAAGESRTQVVIQGTRRAGDLASRVSSALVQQFGVAN